MNLTAGARSHVLLVEQDGSIRDLFSTLLTTHGYSVSTAGGGEEALEQAALRPPHAVFSSLVFSDMDGFELCRRLRSQAPSSPGLVVALTGYSESGIREKVLQAGFDSYLLKPVSVHTLLELLASHRPASGSPGSVGARTASNDSSLASA
ncbi:response regulator [Massilia consociata]|uniref:Response regulator n=1 Tax=Massilia consociata TaxID=760117 RepID=A0ABV6FH08_9BURK